MDKKTHTESMYNVYFHINYLQYNALVLSDPTVVHYQERLVWFYSSDSSGVSAGCPAPYIAVVLVGIGLGWKKLRNVDPLVLVISVNLNLMGRCTTFLFAPF